LEGQEFKRREREEEKDPLTLLSHSWSVEAYNETEALFKGMEKSSLIPDYVWKKLVKVKRIDPALFIIYNKVTKSSIVARVTPASEMPDVLSVIMGRHSPLKKFYVTFYPRTYTTKERHYI
jgi:hypothetical protein